MLSQEKMDIVLMDPDEERLAFSKNRMDILPVAGSPVSLRALERAGVEKADLFVGVSPEETANIMACTLAHNLGARCTLARINNYEYLLPKNKEFFEKLGINDMIYPEMLAAQEIMDDIRRPWTQQYWELLNNSLVLLGVKLHESSRLIGKTIDTIPPGNKQYHIAAIKRQNQTIIPNGRERMEQGDLVFFSAIKGNEDVVRVHAGKEATEIKKIIILGGGRIAIRACQYLPGNLRIRVIEKDREKSHKTAEQMPGNVLVINGDGCDPDLLRQEGIRDTQAFIALTENPGTNILACLSAKQAGVYETIAQVENLDYTGMAEDMDIGAIINKKLIAANFIYRFFLNADVSNVKSLAFADAMVAEFTARPESKITGKPVKDLHLPEGMNLGGLVRQGEAVLVNGDTQVQAGDQVGVFCLDSSIRKIEEYFN
jgi:trk system potassium uptake protein TrkA